MQKNSQNNHSVEQIKKTSNITMASLLNLTFLPVIAFIWLLFEFKKSTDKKLPKYYAAFNLKFNMMVAFSLGAGSLIMIYLGGLNTAWTWVYVIAYFILVHSIFIIIVVCAMTRAWSGLMVRS
ncbi:MAG: hypothetical protein HON94_06100 [Methylococcales bacterium]|jgi:hypothetical protein|nr:hypothetical protein [Methylococcales bacterium]MBT7409018.1 hypothetical protein [Methylococcales bacterium]